MRFSPSVWRRPGRVLAGLAAPALLSLNTPAPAAELSPLPAPVAVAPAPAAVQVLDLHACREYAVAHQPTVAAARANLAAVQMKLGALDNLRGLSSLLARDLPVRRQQAALGVTIAQAEVCAAEWDARYSATFCYLAALYAREQQQLAKESVETPPGVSLKDLREAIDKIVEQGLRSDVSKTHLDLVDSYYALVAARKEAADQGYERALIALREAMNAGPGCRIEPAEQRLPLGGSPPDKEQVIQLAVARRGEVLEADTAEQVYCLEVDAQGALRFPSARTFASGSDLHSQTLPAGQFDPDYRPGALAPEMPPSLVGSRAERKDQAEVYHARSEAVAEKTRNLIALNAEDAYLRWAQHQGEETKFAESAQKMKNHADALAAHFNQHLEKPGYPNVDDVLFARQKTTLLRVEVGRAKFLRLVTLANLERLTAGAFDAGLEGPAVAPAGH